MLVAANARRDHDDAVAVAQVQQRTDPRLARFAAGRGEQGDRALLEGAAELSVAAPVDPGVAARHPFDEEGHPR